MASHGVYAHNPKEAITLLDTAIKQVTYARTLLTGMLKSLALKHVHYSDFSTKAN